MPDFAVIFDMDGTMVENSEYHKKAWRVFLERHGKQLSETEMKNHVYGRSNKETLGYLFGQSLSMEQLRNYGQEKEAIYRELYRPHLKPVSRLVELLETLQKRHIPLAVATAADQPNVDFTLNGLGVKNYFQAIIDADMVIHGKPNPEIFLQAAATLGVPPAKCVVFEDSLSGIQAAKAAGMRVIAITTTHPRAELSLADHIITDFSEAMTYLIH
jgi:beta-phosphoglucomutase family hydrolase